MPLEIPTGNITTEQPSGLLDIPGQAINRVTIQNAKTINTDAVRRNREVNSILGIPSEILDTDDEFAKEEYQVLKDQANRSIAPSIYDWSMQSPENYASVKEDLDSFSIAEHLARKAGSLAGGVVGLGGSVFGGTRRLFNIGHDFLLDSFLAPVDALNPELATELRTTLTEPIPYAPWWTNPDISLEKISESLKETEKELTPEHPSFVEKVIGGVGQLAGQMAIVLASAGLGTGALYAQGADITGEKLDSTRKPGEKPEGWEDLVTVLGAGVTAVTERYGIDNLLHRIPKNVRNRFFRILAGAGSEASQEIMEDIGQNLIIMGFDPSRAPKTTVGDLAEQGAVAGAVGAIAGAIIPGRRSSTLDESINEDKSRAQTTLIMNKANEAVVNSSVNENDSQKAVELRTQAVKGAGITYVAVPTNEFVAHAQKNPELMAAMQDKVAEAVEKGREDIIITAGDFAKHIFGTKHYDALSDSFTYYVKPSVDRTGVSPKQVVNDIIANATALKNKAKLIKNPTQRQKTLQFIDKFVKGEEIDLVEVLAKSPDSMITSINKYLKEIKTEELMTEKEIRKSRLATIKTEIEQIDIKAADIQEEIQERKADKKPTKRLEKKLSDLNVERRTLRAEESLINRTLLSAAKFSEGEKVTTTVDKLRALNVKATRQTEREARKAFRVAKSNIRADIKQAQEVLVNFINKSGISLHKRGQYLAAIKNIQSSQDLIEALPKIQARVLRDIDNQRKAQLKGAIQKMVTKGLKAKTSPSVNNYLKQAKEILKMPVSQAIERLESGNTEGLDPTLINLLGLKAHSNRTDIAAVEKLLLDLSTTIQSGRAIGTAHSLYRIARRDELRARVVDAIGERPTETLSRTKEAANTVLSFLYLGPSANWRGKLQHIFSSKNANIVNKLLNDLSLFAESRAYTRNTRESLERFTKLVQTRTKMTERQLRKQWNQDNSERIDLGTFTMEDGSTKRIERTKAEMRMLYMQAQDPSIRESLRSEANEGGYTDAFFEAIEQQFTSFDRQMIDAQFEFYDQFYNRINEAYKKNYGLNLPKLRKYVPVRRDFGDEDAGDGFLGSLLYQGGPKPASLYERKPGTKVRVRQMSDIIALDSHITEMEYFIAYAEKVNDLNSVFAGNNNEIMNLIRDRNGKKVANAIREDLLWFANKGEISSSVIDSVLNQLMRNFGFAQLGAKPQIGLKQLASFSAFAQDVDSKQFVKYLLKLATPAGWKEARVLMNKSSFFRERGMNFDNDFKSLAKDSHNNNLLNFMGTHPSFTRIMMLPIRYGDKGAILIGGYAHIKSRIAAGESESAAIESFERLANATQQSSDPDQLSALQRTSALARIWAQFLSSANAIARAEYEAISEVIKGRISKGEFAKRMLIYHFMIPNLIMFIANGFEFELEDQLKASLVGAMTGLIIVGDLVEFLGRKVVGSETPFDVEGRHPFDFMQSIFEAVDGDWDIDWDDFVDGSKTLERIFEAGGALTGIPMEALYNMIRGTAKVTEGVLDGDGDDIAEGTGLMLGYSPYTLEK